MTRFIYLFIFAVAYITLRSVFEIEVKEEI